MDNKGRISIPPRFRKILQELHDNLLVLTNYDGYIMAFPQSEWQMIEADLAKQPTFDKEMRSFQRFIFSGVEDCPVDRQGRILIPPHLREYAGINREVVLVGTVRCFEIWDRETFDKHRQQLEESIGQEVYQRLGS
jgi:MraZ protein